MLSLNLCCLLIVNENSMSIVYLNLCLALFNKFISDNSIVKVDNVKTNSVSDLLRSAYVYLYVYKCDLLVVSNSIKSV